MKVLPRIILLQAALKDICSGFIIINRNERPKLSDTAVPFPTLTNDRKSTILNVIKEDKQIQETKATVILSRNNIIENQKKISLEISKEGKRGNFQQALKLYNKSIKDNICNTRILNSIIDACARTRPVRYDVAMELFTNRPSYIKPNVFTFGSLISVCSRSRDHKKAIQLLRSMKDEYGIEPNAVVYSTVIASCSRARPTPDARQALLLLDEVVSHKKISMNVVGYNAVLSTLAKVGDWKKSIDILNKMEEGYYNVIPDSVTYSTVMAACERAERWGDVLYYANIMKNEKHLPIDGISITTVLHACQALGYADLALEYLELMKHNTTLINHKYGKTNGKFRQGVKGPLLEPDHVAYCLTISACSKAGRIKDSIRLFQELNSLNKASVEAYTAVIDGCSTIGNHLLALKLLENMDRKFGLKPTVVTYSSVLTACASAIAKFDAKESQHDTIDVMEREAIIDAAYSLFHDISTSNDTSIHPNIITYNAMLQVYAEGCKLHKCFNLFQKLTYKQYDPTIVTFGTLMSACERVGNVTAIYDVFDYMKLYDIQPNEIVYGAAISCCRKAKQPEKALQLLNIMISSKLKPNIVTFNTALLSLVDGNNNKNQRQWQPNGFFLNKAMDLYNTHLIHDTNRLLGTKNAKYQIKPNIQTYQILIRALSNALRPKEAEAILRQMISSSNDKPDVYLYTSIITAYEKINQPKNSLRLLEEMREIGYDFYDSKLLNELFKRMVKLVHWGTSVVAYD